MSNHITTESGFTKMEIVAILLLMVLIAAVIIPNFVKACQTTSLNSCSFNRMWIEEAKQTWARDNHKSPADTPSASDILPYLSKMTPKWDGRPSKVNRPLKGLPTCFLSGTYTLGKVSERISCSQSNICVWEESSYLYHYGRQKK